MNNDIEEEYESDFDVEEEGGEGNNMFSTDVVSVLTAVRASKGIEDDDEYDDEYNDDYEEDYEDDYEEDYENDYENDYEEEVYETTEDNKENLLNNENNIENKYENLNEYSNNKTYETTDNQNSDYNQTEYNHTIEHEAIIETVEPKVEKVNKLNLRGHKKKKKMNKDQLIEYQNKQKEKEIALEANQFMNIEEQAQCRTDRFWGLEKESRDQERERRNMKEADKESNDLVELMSIFEEHQKWCLENININEVLLKKRNELEQKATNRYLRYFNKIQNSDDIFSYQWPTKPHLYIKKNSTIDNDKKQRNDLKKNRNNNNKKRIKKEKHFPLQKRTDIMKIKPYTFTVENCEQRLQFYFLGEHKNRMEKIDQTNKLKIDTSLKNNDKRIEDDFDKDLNQNIDDDSIDDLSAASHFLRPLSPDLTTSISLISPPKKSKKNAYDLNKSFKGKKKSRRRLRPKTRPKTKKKKKKTGMIGNKKIQYLMESPLNKPVSPQVFKAKIVNIRRLPVSKLTSNSLDKRQDDDEEMMNNINYAKSLKMNSKQIIEVANERRVQSAKNRQDVDNLTKWTKMDFHQYPYDENLDENLDEILKQDKYDAESINAENMKHYNESYNSEDEVQLTNNENESEEKSKNDLLISKSKKSVLIEKDIFHPDFDVITNKINQKEIIRQIYNRLNFMNREYITKEHLLASFRHDNEIRGLARNTLLWSFIKRYKWTYFDSMFSNMNTTTFDDMWEWLKNHCEEENVPENFIKRRHEKAINYVDSDDRNSLFSFSAQLKVQQRYQSNPKYNKGDKIKALSFSSPIWIYGTISEVYTVENHEGFYYKIIYTLGEEYSGNENIILDDYEVITSPQDTIEGFNLLRHEKVILHNFFDLLDRDNIKEIDSSILLTTIEKLSSMDLEKSYDKNIRNIDHFNASGGVLEEYLSYLATMSISIGAMLKFDIFRKSFYDLFNEKNISDLEFIEFCLGVMDIVLMNDLID